MGSSPSKSRQTEIPQNDEPSTHVVGDNDQSTGHSPQLKALTYWEPTNTFAGVEQLLEDKVDLVAAEQDDHIVNGKRDKNDKSEITPTTSNMDNISPDTGQKQEVIPTENESRREVEDRTHTEKDETGTVSHGNKTLEVCTPVIQQRPDTLESEKTAGHDNSFENDRTSTTGNTAEVPIAVQSLSPDSRFSDHIPSGENTIDKTEQNAKWRKQINFGNDVVNKLNKMFSKGNCAYDRTFSGSIQDLYYLLFGLPRGHPEKMRYCKREFGTEMISVGVVGILCDICVELLPEARKLNDMNVIKSTILDNVVSILLSLTDESEDVCELVTNKVDLLESMAEVAVCYEINSDDSSLILNVLSVIYNCSRRASNRGRLREVGFVWILKRFLACEDDFIVFVIAVALAGIMTEEESKIFQTIERAIKVIQLLLIKSLKSREHQCMGASASELAQAISRLAISDSNKILLMTVGVLGPLQQLCNLGDTEEQTEALSAIWTLAFHDDIKDKMLTQDGLIDLLASRRESQDETAKTGASNVLWTLREKLKASTVPRFVTLGEELCRPIETFPSSESDRHIMISYQWQVKKDTIFQLHDVLESQGYKVWLDRKEMKGSMTEAMALAVENAEVFLMCISQSYKESDNCRAEADYAFGLKKHIIPLLMERNYVADGWLGLIKGLKKHYDFSQADYFDMIFEDLLKEIGTKGKSGLSGKPITAGLAGHGGIPASDIPNWTKEKVSDWLKDNECKGRALRSLTGRQLVFLKKLKIEAPEYFYNFLENKLKLGNVEDLTTFVEAVARLK